MHQWNTFLWPDLKIHHLPLTARVQQWVRLLMKKIIKYISECALRSYAIRWCCALPWLPEWARARIPLLFSWDELGVVLGFFFLNPATPDVWELLRAQPDRVCVRLQTDARRGHMCGTRHPLRRYVPRLLPASLSSLDSTLVIVKLVSLKTKTYRHENFFFFFLESAKASALRGNLKRKTLHVLYSCNVVKVIFFERFLCSVSAPSTVNHSKSTESGSPVLHFSKPFMT